LSTLAICGPLLGAIKKKPLSLLKTPIITLTQVITIQSREDVLFGFISPGPIGIKVVVEIFTPIVLPILGTVILLKQ